MQLEAVASCPVAGYLGEETNPAPHCTLLSRSCREREGPPSASSSPDRAAPAPSAAPIRLVLQPPPQPGCPALDMLQPLSVLLGVRGPELPARLRGTSCSSPPAAFCLAAAACAGKSRLKKPNRGRRLLWASGNSSQPRLSGSSHLPCTPTTELQPAATGS